jgi:hypothetical protein
MTLSRGKLDLKWNSTRNGRDELPLIRIGPPNPVVRFLPRALDEQKLVPTENVLAGRDRINAMPKKESVCASACL